MGKETKAAPQRRSHSQSKVTKNNDAQQKKALNYSKDYQEQSIFFGSPVLIMIMCPLTIITLWMFCTQPIDTSLFSISKLSHIASTWSDNGANELKEAFAALGRDLWQHMPMPTFKSLLLVFIFAVFEALLLQFVPGTKLNGPVAPSGDQPTYTLNAIPCFIITHVAFFVCSSPSLPLQWFSPSIIYDNFGAIIIALTVYVKVYCLILFFKGRYYPSGRDNKVTKDAIYDFFWGIELYPRMFGLPLKQFVNCRLGMMGWSVIIVSFAWKQFELYGSLSNAMLINVALQELYILKFYIWESGYFHSIDIMHDRFGYYICWGCMCWITGFYTSPSLWFVHHHIDLPVPAAIAIFGAGLITLWLNWDADHQRQYVRAMQGKCKVWGRTPRLIHAQYTTEDGKTRTNVLLASGWWGIARHVHYITEILTSFFWSLPALHYGLFPYMYAIYLTFLLLDRLLRDEERCQKKYGQYWTQYCKLVPYRVIPYVF